MTEFTEWHLTPRGWERGSSHTRFGGIRQLEAPPDRVLTCRHILAGDGAGESIVDIVEEKWRSSDGDQVERLLVQFGDFGA